MKKILMTTTVVALMASAPAFAQTQAPGFEESVKTVIKDNPKLIVDVINGYMQSQAEADQKAGIDYIAAALKSADFPRIGNEAKEPVGAIFLDYNCPHCRNYHEAIEKVLFENPDVSFVVMEFPILTPESSLAARAALVAKAHGKYADVSSDFLSGKSKLTADDVYAELEKIGISKEQFDKDGFSPEITKQLSDNLEFGRKAGITGTPATVIGGQIYGGEIPAEDLTKLISGK